MVLTPNEANVATKLLTATKRDLVPEHNEHHELKFLNQFMENKFDHYTHEYSDFFQIEISQFEKKFEMLKREIQLNLLSEKRTLGSSSMNVNAGGDSGGPGESLKGNQGSNELNQKELDAQEKALESKKFPSLAYLRKMGVDNFQPSIRHKVQSGHKVFNILNDPMIANVSPRIECNWKGGGPPKLNRTYLAARKLQEQADYTEDLIV